MNITYRYLWRVEYVMHKRVEKEPPKRPETIINNNDTINLAGCTVITKHKLYVLANSEQEAIDKACSDALQHEENVFTLRSVELFGTVLD